MFERDNVLPDAILEHLQLVGTQIFDRLAVLCGVDVYADEAGITPEDGGLRRLFGSYRRGGREGARRGACHDGRREQERGHLGAHETSIGQRWRPQSSPL